MFQVLQLLEKTLTLNEKKALRWRAFADKLEDESERNYLLDLIDEFYNFETKEEEIIEFIRQRKQNFLRGSSAPQAHDILRSSMIDELKENSSSSND